MTHEDRDRLAAQLVRHEGLRLKVYRDSLGIETIGVGRNLRDRGITDAEAYTLLNNDIDECLRSCSAAFPWFDGLDLMRQRVWIDLCFNMGLSRLMGFKKSIAAMAANDFQAAAAELEDSTWYGQVGKRGPWLCLALRTGAEPPTEGS